MHSYFSVFLRPAPDTPEVHERCLESTAAACLRFGAALLFSTKKIEKDRLVGR